MRSWEPSGRPARGASRVAALILAWAVAGSCASPPPSSAPEARRPVVLLVHGRGLQERDSAEVRREWVSALERGLSAVAERSPLTERDVRMVWYADALDPGSSAACRTDPTGGPETGAGVEVSSVIGAIGTLFGAAAEWTGEAGRPGLRSVAADLLYFGDAERRCAAEERLADALARTDADGRPVVLVAHSFGSFLAYRLLQARGESGGPAIERLITIGSLLGVPEVRSFLYRGADPGGPPAGARSWVNVRDTRDPLSAPLADAGEGYGATAIDRTTERQVVGDSHPARHYLEDPVTARAVLEGWCAALGRSGGARSDSLTCSAESRESAAPGSTHLETPPPREGRAVR